MQTINEQINTEEYEKHVRLVLAHPVEYYKDAQRGASGVLSERMTARMISDKALSTATKLKALAINISLRTGRDIETVWNGVLTQRYPNERALSLAEYQELVNQAFFASMAKGMIHRIGNEYVTDLEAERDLKDGSALDGEWTGLHTTTVPQLEYLANKMLETMEQERDVLPRGHSSLLHLLVIRIKDIFQSSFDNFDTHSKKKLLSLYPYCHEEFMGSVFSCIGEASQLSAERNAEAVRALYKTLAVAFQRTGMKGQKTRAYCYIICHMIAEVCVCYDHYVAHVSRMRTFNGGKVGTSHKEWKALRETEEKVYALLFGRKWELPNEDFSNLARKRMKELIHDLTYCQPVSVQRRVSTMLLERYIDYVLAYMKVKLVRGERIPFSWARHTFQVLGKKEEVRKFFQVLAKPGLLPKMPLDDLDDAADMMQEWVREVQRIVVKEDKDGDKITVGIDVDTNAARYKKNEPIFRWRMNILSDEYPAQPEPSNEEKLRQRMWLKLVRTKGAALERRDFHDLYYALNGSQRAVDRFLQSLGTLANASRTTLRKMRRQDFDDMGEDTVIGYYRKRGFRIPVGTEEMFLDELGSANQMLERAKHWTGMDNVNFEVKKKLTRTTQRDVVRLSTEEL